MDDVKTDGAGRGLHLDRRQLVAAALAAPALAASLPAAAQPPTAVGGERGTLLVRGATIVSMDPGVGDLARGDILVRDGAIEAVAPKVPPAAGAWVIEAEGAIAVPGFVNGHIHLAQTLQRGISTEHSFGDYFRTIVLRYSNRMSPEDVGAGDYAGALEQIALGTTTLVDWSREAMTPEHAEAAVDALLRSGARAIFAYTIAARGPDGSDAAGRRMVEHAKALRAGRLSSDAGRVRLGVCLPGPDFMPLEPALADLTLLRELDVLTSFHCGAPIYAQRKRRVVATLAERGLLNARMQLVHANDLDPDEYRIAADRGASLASTPEVEMHMGHGFPAVGRAREAGLAISLGTDIPSAVGGGMLPQMRVALAVELAQRNAASFAGTGKPPEAKPLSARAVLEMATIGGARAVGLGDVTGSLAPGKRAGLLLVRAGSPGTAPGLDPVGTVVLQASPADIDTVIVDGRVLKEAGRLTDPGAPRALADLRERALRMMENARRG